MNILNNNNNNIIYIYQIFLTAIFNIQIFIYLLKHVLKKFLFGNNNVQ